MKIIAKVIATKRHGTSRVGNPSYIVALEEPDGTTEIYFTKANSGLAYAIRNRNYREQWHEYELTSDGKIRSAREIEGQPK